MGFLHPSGSSKPCLPILSVRGNKLSWWLDGYTQDKKQESNHGSKGHVLGELEDFLKGSINNPLKSHDKELHMFTKLESVATTDMKNDAVYILKVALLMWLQFLILFILSVPSPSATEDIERGGEERKGRELEGVGCCDKLAVLKQRAGSSFLHHSFILGTLSGIQRGHCLLSDDILGFKVSPEIFFFS